MTKDIIGWNKKLYILAGTTFTVLLPLMMFLPDAIKGDKTAILFVIAFLAMIDLVATTKIERLEKRISDLETEKK